MSCDDDAICYASKRNIFNCLTDIINLFTKLLNCCTIQPYCAVKSQSVVTEIFCTYDGTDLARSAFTIAGSSVWNRLSDPERCIGPILASCLHCINTSNALWEQGRWSHWCRARQLNWLSVRQRVELKAATLWPRRWSGHADWRLFPRRRRSPKKTALAWDSKRFSSVERRPTWATEPSAQLDLESGTVCRVSTDSRTCHTVV